MLAVYKKELKQYFCSMTGFVFLAFFLAIVGFYTWGYNLAGGMGNFEITLGSISFLFVLLIPILTMRIVAEEKHQKTDQLLFTAPVSPVRIVIGKYLAVLTLFTIGTAVISIYPLIISAYGKDVRLAAAYSSIVGFYLLGASYIAIGTFISSLTESQIIAAVLSFVTMLVSHLLTSITSMLPSDKLTQCILIAIAWLVVCLAVYYIMKNSTALIVMSVAGEAVIWIIFLVKSSLYKGLFSTILNSFAVSERFNDFSMGILNYDAVIYYISITFLFVFLTVQAVKRFHKGAVSITITIIVAVVVVISNIAFEKLDLSTDLSSGKLYTLSDDTKKIMRDAKHDISVYYMVQDGKEETHINKVIKQYGKVSDKIKVKKVDPVTNPSFASKYVDDEVSSNDVIVVNNDTKAAKYISGSEMYYSQVDYSTYQSSYFLDVEGKITSAIQNVLSDKKTKMYIMTGHQEQNLGSFVTDSLSKMNIDTEELKLYSQDAVPDDCDILLLNGPSRDISKEEKTRILKYMKNGGYAIINVEYTTSDTPNIKELLKYYGINEQMGNICETTGNYYNYVNCIVPSTSSTESITSNLNGMLVIPYPVALSQVKKDSLRNTLEISKLLTTSEGSYLKVDPSSGDGSKSAGDIEGPFSVGISVSDNISKNKTAKLIAFGSATAFSDDFTMAGQLDNAALFENAVASLLKTDVKQTSIDVKSLSYSYITLKTGTQLGYAAFLIVIIPLFLLITGVIIWVRRRRK